MNMTSVPQASTDPSKEFPILCSTCLGPNTHTRMVCKPNGAACKICERPFTIFRWQPGPGPRYKKTEICRTCAKVKNVCQTCIFDLVYNLPVAVRDAIKSAENAEGGDGSSNFNPINVPTTANEAGKLMAKIEYNQDLASAIDEMYSAEPLPQLDVVSGKVRRSATKNNNNDPAAQANKLLSTLSRAPRGTDQEKDFARNKSRVCSFWQRGECLRGDTCPYLHKDIHQDKTLGKQSLKSRYYGQDDAFANKILERLEKEKNTKSEKYPPLPTKPEDDENTTIWLDLNPIFEIDPDLQQKDLPSILFPILQPYGTVIQHKIRRVPKDQQHPPSSSSTAASGDQKNTQFTSFALIRFATRQQAENVLAQFYPVLEVMDTECHINWGKHQLELSQNNNNNDKQQDSNNNNNGNNRSNKPDSFVPPPPPTIDPTLQGDDTIAAVLFQQQQQQQQQQQIAMFQQLQLQQQMATMAAAMMMNATQSNNGFVPPPPPSTATGLPLSSVPPPPPLADSSFPSLPPPPPPPTYSNNNSSSSSNNNNNNRNNNRNNNNNNNNSNNRNNNNNTNNNNKNRKNNNYNNNNSGNNSSSNNTTRDHSMVPPPPPPI